MPRTLDELAWPVRTRRTSLRPANPEDLDATWRYRQLESVSFYLATAPDLQSYRARFLDPERLASCLVMELGDEIAGDLMLAVEDGWAQSDVADRAKGVQAKLGWCLDPAYAGLGYATEAVTEMLRICFVDLELRRVSADCFADNLASVRLMERVGMRREMHTVKDSLHRSRGWLDGMSYALLAEEWRTRSPQPEPA